VKIPPVATHGVVRACAIESLLQNPFLRLASTADFRKLSSVSPGAQDQPGASANINEQHSRQPRLNSGKQTISPMISDQARNSGTQTGRFLDLRQYACCGTHLVPASRGTKRALVSQLVIFDIDGTLTLTNEVDSHCYVRAIFEFLGVAIDDDWSHYRHVTDSGIARELFGRHRRCLEDLNEVRNRFVALLEASLNANPEGCRQVVGADNLLDQLRGMPDVTLGLATGGWAASALVKLRHAGLNIDGLAFASADDAEARTEIMAICLQRAAHSASVHPFDEVTYIGDGLWDAIAADALGWRFIGIGDGPHAERLRSAGAGHVFPAFRNHQEVLLALGLGRA
jgi:phosphoglycolate phosphatase-like HAD superfamily hydrolase